ncbi:MAG: hypothetical protein HDR48_00335 [Bacteroides sp.]|nr:hypothetical protein [Bacteroides sp.]
MKKIIFASIIAMVFCGSANAQYSYSSASRLDSIENALASANTKMAEMRADSIHSAVWSKATSFEIGYAAESSSSEVYERQNAKFGFFFNFNHNYLFPKSKAWGNIVKVGLNVRWFDLDYAMYKDFYRDINPRNSITSGWTSNITTSDGDMRAKFQQMTLLAGVCGVGPTVTVAPFSFMNNALSALKVNLYFHYQPTLGLNLYMIQPQLMVNNEYINGSDKDTEIELGYVSMWDLGFRIQWRNIGIGVEGRWGSGKLKNTVYSPYFYANSQTYQGIPINVNGAADPDKNYTRKFGQTRVYFDIAF